MQKNKIFKIQFVILYTFLFKSQNTLKGVNNYLYTHWRGQKTKAKRSDSEKII